MRDMGSFAGQLLLRSVDRAERVYRAMKARGYRGEYFSGDAGIFGASSALYAILLSAAMLLARFVPWTNMF
jgi:cobalt/nickel transport system permease protein